MLHQSVSPTLLKFREARIIRLAINPKDGSVMTRNTGTETPAWVYVLNTGSN